MTKPGGFGGNFDQIMRQAQRMQRELAKIQEEHGDAQFEGSAAGGMVKATVNGRHEVIRIDVDRGTTDVSDLDLVLDLVAAAVNDGIRKAREALKEQTASLTGGMSIPGLF